MLPIHVQCIKANMNKQWADIFFNKDNISKFSTLLKSISHIPSNLISPHYNNILRTFNYVSPSETKVVIIGDSPYLSPDESNGLAYSTNAVMTGSLYNIQRALTLSYPEQHLSPDLTSWVKQGVLLLNRNLTYNTDWTPFTDFVVEWIDINLNVLFVLWGDYAQQLTSKIKRSEVLTWNDPAPVHNILIDPKLSFNYCPHFKQINEYLKLRELSEIVWGDVKDNTNAETIICTDGAAKANGKSNARASYAFIVVSGPKCGYKESGEIYKCGTYMPSNNRGEMIAGIKAVQYMINNNLNGVIYSDNNYTVNTFNIWSDKWVKNNELDDKSNKDLIQEIININKIKKIKFIHCAGHTSPPDKQSPEYIIWKGNYDADKLATSVLRK